MYWVIKFRDTSCYNTDTYTPADVVCEASKYDSLEAARDELKSLREPRSQEHLDLLLDHGEPYIVKVTPKKKQVKQVINQWLVSFTDGETIHVWGQRMIETINDKINSLHIKDIVSVVKVN